MGHKKGPGLRRERSPSELLGFQTRFPGEAAAPLFHFTAEQDPLHRTDPALTQCPPRPVTSSRSRALMVLTSQGLQTLDNVAVPLYHCILPRCCQLLHLFLPFPKPTPEKNLLQKMASPSFLSFWQFEPQSWAASATPH